MNTRENFWNVFCFATNQKWDETAKDKRQTAACISHDLIRSNELASCLKELAFLPQLTFKNQTTEFGIDLEVKFTMVQVFPLSYKKIWIENHQSQPTSMTLWIIVIIIILIIIIKIIIIITFIMRKFHKMFKCAWPDWTAR